MKENKGNTDIYIINADGTNLRALKNSAKSESSPKFLPGGKKISYIVDDQIHTCNLDGSNDQKITDFYSGTGDYRWSNRRIKNSICFQCLSDCANQECNKKKDEEKKESKVDARIITHLMFRHWNRWLGDKRSHLFLYDLNKKVYYDLTFKMENDVPPLDLGSSNDFNFSPDGKEVAYTMNPLSVVANSTNNEIYKVDLSKVKKESKAPSTKISESKGNDNQPVYSPDGEIYRFLFNETSRS